MAQAQQLYEVNQDGISRPSFKFCTRCQIEKASTEFGIHHMAADGLQGWCRACHSAVSAERHAKRAADAANGIVTEVKPRVIKADPIQDWANKLMASGEPVLSSEIKKQARERGYSEYRSMNAISITGAVPSGRGNGTSWRLPEAWREPEHFSPADQLELPDEDDTPLSPGRTPDNVEYATAARSFLARELRMDRGIPRVELIEKGKAEGITEGALMRAANTMNVKRAHIVPGRKETAWWLPEPGTPAKSRAKQVPATALVTRQQGELMPMDERRGPPEIDLAAMFSQFMGGSDFDKERARHELLVQMVSNQNAMMMELLRG